MRAAGNPRRFRTSRDPLEDATGKAYAYVDGDPLTQDDPTGLEMGFGPSDYAPETWTRNTQQYFGEVWGPVIGFAKKIKRKVNRYLESAVPPANEPGQPAYYAMQNNAVMMIVDGAARLARKMEKYGAPQEGGSACGDFAAAAHSGQLSAAGLEKATIEYYTGYFETEIDDNDLVERISEEYETVEHEVEAGAEDSQLSELDFITFGEDSAVQGGLEWIELLAAFAE